jgi:tetratricopeptide (TPR) repeat protein
LSTQRWTSAISRGRAATLAVAALLAAGTASAQIPDKFENLQVLPKDISREQLVDTMRAFTAALGVRCEHCHAGGPQLKDMRFAADDKPEKAKARAMMQMVRAINQDHLGKLEMRQGVRVRCVTCHHGVILPEPIEAIVSETLANNGPEQAVARYRELREKYYGSAAYDFGERPLTSAAEELVKQGKPQQALALLELNLEYFPESGRTVFQMGETYLAAGDKEKAKASFERALKLNPENERAKKRLEELAAPGQ